MAETLGKMEKPEAESFKLGRKLIFVPLIFLPTARRGCRVDKTGK